MIIFNYINKDEGIKLIYLSFYLYDNFVGYIQNPPINNINHLFNALFLREYIFNDNIENIIIGKNDFSELSIYMLFFVYIKKEVRELRYNTEERKINGYYNIYFYLEPNMTKELLKNIEKFNIFKPLENALIIKYGKPIDKKGKELKKELEKRADLIIKNEDYNDVAEYITLQLTKNDELGQNF